MKIFILAFFLLGFNIAQGAFPEYIQIYNPVTRRISILKNCVVPNIQYQPQPGFTQAQTCDCNWLATGSAYSFVCKMPTGVQTLQTADPRLYTLVPYGAKSRLVRNCTPPDYMTLKSQPGVSLTCFCSWRDTSSGLVLGCELPQGFSDMTIADPRIYRLVRISSTQNAIELIKADPCSKKGANEEHASQSGIENSLKNCKK